MLLMSWALQYNSLKKQLTVNYGAIHRMNWAPFVQAFQSALELVLRRSVGMCDILVQRLESDKATGARFIW